MSIESGTLLFRHVLSVRVGDINFANHLDANRFFSLIHQVRALFFRANGMSEADFFGCAMFMLEQSAKYKGQAYFDDPLCFEMFLETLKGVTIVINFRVSHRDTGDLIATASNTLGCFKLEQKKLIHHPEEMRAFFLGDLVTQHTSGYTS